VSDFCSEYGNARIVLLSGEFGRWNFVWIESGLIGCRRSLLISNNVGCGYMTSIGVEGGSISG